MADNKQVAPQATEPKLSMKQRAESVLQGIREIVTTALPSTISRDAFRDVFLTVALKEPKIFAANRESLQQALIASARAGLMPDGKMAALVPFMNNKSKKDNKLEVQFIVMVMGYIHLFKKHGGVHSMAVNVVYSNDEFEYVEGDNTILRHRPMAFAEPEERGDMVGVYGIFKDAEGRVMHREVMGRGAVMKAKAVSKMSGSGPWQQFEEEMWRKTLVRRAAKYLPLTAEAQKILDAEDSATIDFDLPTQNVRHQGYSPIGDAANGVIEHQQREEAQHDENGVFEEDVDQNTDNGDEPWNATEDEVDDDPLADGTVIDPNQSETQSEVEKPKADEKARPVGDKPTDKQLDDAWNLGLDAGEGGLPREVPSDMLESCHATFLKGWDKGQEAREKAAAKAAEKEGKKADDTVARTVENAKKHALAGKEREVPKAVPAAMHQTWLDAYDAQVKDAELHG